MNFRKVAAAFDLKYLKIRVSEIKKILKKALSNKKPYLIEVFTDPKQYIHGKKS